MKGNKEYFRFILLSFLSQYLILQYYFNHIISQSINYYNYAFLHAFLHAFLLRESNCF